MVMVKPRLTSFLCRCAFCVSLFLSDDWRPRARRDHRRRHPEPSVPSSNSLMPEFNDEVSPWNTRQSMRTSDDVAQLLVSDRTVVVSMYSRAV